MPRGAVFDTFFNEALIHQLETLGTVCWNEKGRQYTHAELCRQIEAADICVTGWGTPALDAEVMRHAKRLRLLAHTGGSVSAYASAAVYEKGVCVVSGNRVFAQSVAEGVIAYALAALRRLPYYSARLAGGDWPGSFTNRGLLGRSVGIVGYGMIAQYLVGMLAPFGCPVQVYSRHITAQELDAGQMTHASLTEIFAGCEIVSLHSGMTADNYHMITEPLLRSMRPGALLINTARGALVDEAALCRVLADRPDLTAVLDVYEAEPLPPDHPLTKLPNTLLMPHMGGPTIDRRPAVTQSLLADIQNFLAGQPLSCAISESRAAKMSAY